MPRLDFLYRIAAALGRRLVLEELNETNVEPLCQSQHVTAGLFETHFHQRHQGRGLTG